MNRKVRPLIEILTEIADPRKPKGKRHPLSAVLALCVVAMMSGAKNPRQIANWWKSRKGLGPFLELLGFTREYGPSESTLYLVLGMIGVGEFEAKVGEWIEGILAGLSGGMEGIAVDGKTLRGSQQQGAENAHLLSALSHRLGVIVSQLGVDDKTNEIGAMSEFLEGLVIEGRVFTMDALLTQRKVAETIVEEGGDYVMTVKDNQPGLRSDLEMLFAEPGAGPFIHDEASTTDKGHGRIETRRIRTSIALTGFLDWPGLQQGFVIERQVVRGNKTTIETTYGITSLSPDQADAMCILSLVRGHWSIENRLHWVRDVTFGEDLSQVRKGSLPQMMAALRNCVINLFRLLKFRYVPDAFAFFAARPLEALKTIRVETCLL